MTTLTNDKKMGFDVLNNAMGKPISDRSENL